MKLYKSGNPDFGKLSGLYMGDAMTGKTHLACSWPSPLLISFDPDTQTARKLPGVQVLEPESWEEFDRGIVPYVKNRTASDLVKEHTGEAAPIETICIDTISIASTYLAQEIQGHKERLTQADFGLFLSKLTSATMQMVEATRERPDGAPSYHIIFTTHLTQVTDDSGTVTAIRPAIMGQFKDLLPRLFGFSFLCIHEVETQGKIPNVKEVPVWKVRTVPPSKLYVCGDRIGGGSYNRLPTKTGGTYPELMEAWGMNAKGNETG